MHNRAVLYIVTDYAPVVTGETLLAMSRICAARLRQCIRPSDDVRLLRNGAQAVMLRGVASSSAVAAFARRALEALRAAITVGGTAHRAMVHIGYGLGVSGRDETRRMLAAARKAAHRARQAGESLRGDAGLTVGGERDLHDLLQGALNGDGLEMRYQPVLRLDNGAIGSVEALMRLRGPEGVLIGPSVFIPYAERTGLIRQLSLFALRRAAEQARQMREIAGPDFRVAVNVSGAQLRDRSLVEDVIEACSNAGCPPAALTIEVTETVLIDDLARASRVLSALRALGAKIALDDFGAKYSWFDYLYGLPIDIVKLDRGFIDSMLKTDHPASMLGMITSAAHRMKLEIVAEGGASPETTRMLRALGVDYLQAGQVAPPLSAEKARHLLKVASRGPL